MKRLTLIDKAFLLKRTPLFCALDLNFLLSVADKLSHVSFDPGDNIFVINEEANRMYFIVKGQVEIQDANHKVLCKLSNGDFFGEESLFNNKPRDYAAFSPGESHVFTLSRTNLYAIISECPSVAVGLLQVYTSALKFRPINDN